MHGLEPGPPPLPITWDLISNSHVLFLDPQCTIGIYFFPWWFLVYITVKETLVLLNIRFNQADKLLSLGAHTVSIDGAHVNIITHSQLCLYSNEYLLLSIEK